ncbi:MAG TPA: hypothetical protein VIF64_06255 [Pyrinomonadaceae bacterium]|jgi:hypothetical protein
MKQHPAWLAAGLLVFVVLACSLGKMKNGNTNSNSNSNAAREVDLGPGVAIGEIHMAKDDNGRPGAETDTFEPGDRTVHCVVRLKEPKAGTQMRFAWWAVEVGKDQNQKIQEIAYTTKPNEDLIHGHLTYPRDWPAGKYKVQIYVNGDLDKTVFYTVR